ncbi:hypothetical protein AAVH_39921, partial [Aphelenchoides avenae]
TSDTDEGARAHIGYIVLGFKTVEETHSMRFAANWQYWSGVRLLCSSLPAPCTFRRLGFFREISHTCQFQFVLLIQVNRLMLHLTPSLNLIHNLDTRLCAYVGIYREIDFELDAEVLNLLSVTAEAVVCKNPSMTVKFAESPCRRMTLPEITSPFCKAKLRRASSNDGEEVLVFKIRDAKYRRDTNSSLASNNKRPLTEPSANFSRYTMSTNGTGREFSLSSFYEDYHADDYLTEPPTEIRPDGRISRRTMRRWSDFTLPSNYRSRSHSLVSAKAFPSLEPIDESLSQSLASARNDNNPKGSPKDLNANFAQRVRNRIKSLSPRTLFRSKHPPTASYGTFMDESM